MSNKEQIAELTWFKTRLEQSKLANKGVIIALHNAPYSTGAASTWYNEEIIKYRYIPLFESYSKVRLVLSGHIHMYERSLKKGIYYIVNGPAGGMAHNYSTIVNPYQQFIDTLANTFSIIKVNNKRIKVETYNQNTELIDQIDIPWIN